MAAAPSSSEFSTYSTRADARTALESFTFYDPLDRVTAPARLLCCCAVPHLRTLFDECTLRIPSEGYTDDGCLTVQDFLDAMAALPSLRTLDVPRAAALPHLRRLEAQGDLAGAAALMASRRTPTCISNAVWAC
ncbi:hypothetical protein BV25DRAFT_1920531 [Artomyces pyxidatus]|uniref:Uncharacterized protein n=1 Tax=Artomyces pyxidatus TaxID=48021 RepID=A0ACB8SKD3_9AGAM|nr:hypothetical protein BV25DRAFT_1920531 [Artomyces pyxidatus]